MQKPTLFQQLIRHISGNPPHARFAASPVNERNVTQGLDWSALYRDRYAYDRERVLSEALLAWRLNPLARRIVEIQTQYVTDGIDFHCDPAPTSVRKEGAGCDDEQAPLVSSATKERAGQAEQFLRDFWNHPLNRIGAHLAEWSDELALTGNLFVSLTTDRAGMSYLRVYPTDLIAEIETAPNDVQQERSYLPKATASNPNPKTIASYWAKNVNRESRTVNSISNSSQSPNHYSQFTNHYSRPVILHYAVNRLSGMLWGEPDLAPLLPWLARYAAWLEDRMRLNRFRQAYLYVVKGQYASEAERVARQQQLLASPPQPGSILVTDASEEWGVISPMLDSTDANSDGLALKKFIAGGRGYPLHWLAEPESSTRTTAEAAGTPTFKGLESRQQMFLSMLKDILQVVLQRRAQFTNQPVPNVLVSVEAADITERDNAALALASTQVVASFGQLWAGGLIGTDEYLRVVYRFAGEVLPSARPDAPRAQAAPYPRPSGGVSVDADSGDVTTREE